MRSDIPFWTWVLARRLPIFALIATVIMALGATLISRHSQSYTSTAELLLDPRATQASNTNPKTHFEFLKFRVLTSAELDRTIQNLSLGGDPINRISAAFDPASGKIRIGFYDPNPEAAFALTTTLSQTFVNTAKTLDLLDADGKLTTQTAEVRALQKPVLAKSASGPNKSSMYLALLCFAIFCGLIVILILEWLDTVIRRPHDVSSTLGFATFGVIPDLQLQPIDPTSRSERGT